MYQVCTELFKSFSRKLIKFLTLLLWSSCRSLYEMNLSLTKYQKHVESDLKKKIDFDWHFHSGLSQLSCITRSFCNSTLHGSSGPLLRTRIHFVIHIKTVGLPIPVEKRKDIFFKSEFWLANNLDHCLINIIMVEKKNTFEVVQKVGKEQKMIACQPNEFFLDSCERVSKMGAQLSLTCTVL